MSDFQLLLLLGAALFCIGLYTILSSGNRFRSAMGIVLLLNAGQIVWLTFARFSKNGRSGELFTLFSMSALIAGVAIVLAMIYKIRINRDTAGISALPDVEEKWITRG